MTSGKKTKAARSSVQAARSSVVASKPKPWGTIIAVIAVLALAGTVFTYAYSRIAEKNAAEAALAKWVPSEENKDPSEQIAGVVKKEYPAGKHVTPDQRVAYDQSPPFGGPHDQSWAVCTGVVYDKAVRNENMVHALEHGAVWIAYNPDQVSGDALDKLKAKADGQPFTMLSPYPGLDKPISLQAWGRQLKLDSADDERIDQFIRSLRTNKYTYPELGATCDSSTFDVDNPPPFVAEAPGEGAVPMEGGTEDTSETGNTGTAPSTQPSS
ncbi:DUF3105 domain-containing protein [Saccharothrix coeruleofusca]|uniref:DUF3105 domain-containing protein n=1 Tax=Saccharothrix coeruleofusca TaxID=33919 RepID=A0A918AMD0_9PSEU|nr:DUF3105 domain-containing protein [Saccharothrix coeruleofusca]MBP2338792.1 hypothetical protein [Saccharothrix coeruleofusca]GGP45920.1 hypothetical protein GCM10010185_16920 [Saccharothrix coeruleofusca]